MKLIYLEHYPHYMGTRNTTVEIDEINLALMATLACDSFDAREDLLEELDFALCIDACREVGSAFKVLKKDGKYGPFALTSFVTADHSDKDATVRRFWTTVLKALKTKGFWAGVWEEGSYAICRADKRKEGLNALARIEARIAEDTFDW